jgi:hypothetical protein
MADEPELLHAETGGGGEGTASQRYDEEYEMPPLAHPFAMDEREARKVFLFSGHMVDAPRRPAPRFPGRQEFAAAAAIAAKLNELDGGAQDVGLCGGACGGDLLFAEAMLARGARLALLLAFDEATFLAHSVDFAGDEWRRRFFAVKAHPQTRVMLAPDALGPLPEGADPYERTNLWLLESALALGPERVEFICLWDGGGGDGPGGTRHMVAEVTRRRGRVHWLDTHKLW